MQLVSVSRFLSLPGVAVLAGLAVACDDAPTAPQPTPSLGSFQAAYVDDQNQSCPRGYQLIWTGILDHPVDQNLNLLICRWNNGATPLYVDDYARGGCPAGYQQVQVSAGMWGKEVDVNSNGYVCHMTT